jgi:hypothetical protein
MYLYTNYDTHTGKLKFRDLIPVQRPYGSNETEYHLTDESEIIDWVVRLTDKSREPAVPLLGGLRYYLD